MLIVKRILKIVALSSVFFAMSCASFEDQRVYFDVVSEADRVSLEEIETLLLRTMILERENSDMLLREQILSDALASLTSLSSADRVNKLFKARLLGFSAWIKILRNEELNLNKIVKKMETLTKREEFIFILQAEQERVLGSIVRLYELSSETAFTHTISNLLLAEAVFDKGDFERSAVLMDELILELPKFAHSYLISKRKMAVSLQKSSSKNENPDIDRQSLLLQGYLTVGEMILVIHKSTDFLLNFSFNKNEPQNILSDLLIKEGMLFSDSRFDKKALREDLAYLVLNIIALLENNPSLKTKYSELFKPDSGIDSPILDVEIDDKVFNAVLFLVEKNIMNLPDGVSFSPKKEILPETLFSVIEELKKKY